MSDGLAYITLSLPCIFAKKPNFPPIAPTLRGTLTRNSRGFVVANSCEIIAMPGYRSRDLTRRSTITGGIQKVSIILSNTIPKEHNKCIRKI